jgi:hypothetical protein
MNSDSGISVWSPSSANDETGLPRMITCSQRRREQLRSRYIFPPAIRPLLSVPCYLLSAHVLYYFRRPPERGVEYNETHLAFQGKAFFSDNRLSWDSYAPPHWGFFIFKESVSIRPPQHGFSFSKNSFVNLIAFGYEKGAPVLYPHPLSFARCAEFR